MQQMSRKIRFAPFRAEIEMQVVSDCFVMLCTDNAGWVSEAGFSLCVHTHTDIHRHWHRLWRARARLRRSVFQGLPWWAYVLLYPGCFFLLFSRTNCAVSYTALIWNLTAGYINNGSLVLCVFSYVTVLSSYHTMKPWSWESLVCL